MEAATATASDEVLWEAVRRRDPQAEGSFYYSVATTGVYCRPTCAARLPRRENVAFHTSRAAAEQAGFRPCRRCRPDGASVLQRREAMVAQACRLIDAAETPPSLAELAAAAALSPHHFHRQFKAATGVTPKAFAAARRMGRVQAGLAAGAGVTAAIFEAGFNASSRFYEAADAMLGMTPTAYRAGGRGQTIRSTIRPCSLGLVLIAATARGLCAIRFGDSKAALADELRHLFPQALIEPADTALASWAEAVVGLIEAPARGLDLPLDIQGTAFQRRVWEALKAIPPGTTTSYAELAARIGAPKSVRAVANACGANPVAVAVPCHRVLQRDGGLGGYRWGKARKEALLAREAAP